MLQNGLYEQIISRGLEKELSDSDQLVQTAAIDTEEAAKVLKKCGDVKTAIIMIKAGVDEELARMLLARNEGIVGKVFQALGITGIR